MQGELPQSSLRDASPLGDGATGETGSFSVLPKAPTLGELSSECETERARMLSGSGGHSKPSRPCIAIFFPE